MGDIRFASQPVLPIMRLGAKQIGLIDFGDLVRLEIFLQYFAQVADTKIRGTISAVG